MCYGAGWGAQWKIGPTEPGLACLIRDGAEVRLKISAKPLI